MQSYFCGATPSLAAHVALNETEYFYSSVISIILAQKYFDGDIPLKNLQYVIILAARKVTSSLTLTDTLKLTVFLLEKCFAISKLYFKNCKQFI